MTRHLLFFVLSMIAAATACGAEPLRFRFESKPPTVDGSPFAVPSGNVEWDPAATALIVCDVWDQHHSINAVRRLAEFAPRLNELVAEARRRGVTIIHAPSDCMAAYAEHPARLRALNAPRAANLPPNVAEWCSIVPAERKATYPIDQSDGGSDDDPAEGRAWAAKLKAMGRNPGTPWQRQSDAIAIDAERDFISDRGDEVWSVLESRGVKNVILTGVHVNMCVLGRPFGLRRMVLGGKNVILVRDLTDAMYNPAMWPFVDHYTGTERVIEHIERYVCPTITSDQLLGGKPYCFAGDHRSPAIVEALRTEPKLSYRETLERQWSTTTVPSLELSVKELSGLGGYDGPIWFRCVVRVPESWRTRQTLLILSSSENDEDVWLNGTRLRDPGIEVDEATATRTYVLPSEAVLPGDANLIAVRHAGPAKWSAIVDQPALQLFERAPATIPLAGRWQFRIGDDSSWSNMPLPAKFGTSTDIVFEATETKQP